MSAARNSYDEAWPAELIAQRKTEIAAGELEWRVVESVPVHETSKCAPENFERHENYRIMLQRIGAAGIGIVAYDFMLVMDRVRTDGLTSSELLEAMRFKMLDSSL